MKDDSNQEHLMFGSPAVLTHPSNVLFKFRQFVVCAWLQGRIIEPKETNNCFTQSYFQLQLVSKVNQREIREDNTSLLLT